MATFVPQEPIDTDTKSKWNKFIDFVEANKMAGSPLLDQRNKSVGMGLLQKFNMTNPKDALPMDIVPKVQQSLQDYRSNLINQWKSGKMQADIKSPDEVMPGISPVDGWPGTKTLSSRFPTASVTIVTPDTTIKKNYGLNTDQYDKDRGISGSK